MGQAQLELIRQENERAKSVNRRVFGGKPAKFLKNFREIRGRELDRSWIYRQMGTSDADRKTIYGDFKQIYMGSHFTDPARAKVFVDDFLHTVRLCDEFAEPVLTRLPFVVRDYWTLNETLQMQIARSQKQKMTGDLAKAKRTLADAQRTIDEMTRALEAEEEMKTGAGKYLFALR